MLYDLPAQDTDFSVCEPAALRRAESAVSSVFYREPRHVYPRIARADGVWVEDSEGRRYLDGSGGAAVNSVGHNHPDVIAAIRRQLETCAYAHTMFFTNEPQEQLADRLAARFPEQGARVYFVSGGSEANETALKLARQYWVAHGRDSKALVISRQQSYHGNTLGALSLSGNPGRRKLYAPLLRDWPKIAPCYAYRHRQSGESDEQYGQRAADELQREIDRHGADNVAAFVAETVVGATLGAVPPAPGYLARIRDICNRNDVLLVLDEVMSGSGRCGSWFAFEQDEVCPDIVTLAKGLSSGYQPLGAAIVRGALHDAVVDAHGAFAHGHTWVGHATACAAGVAVSEVVDRESLLERAAQVGARLREDLATAFRDHPQVGDIRGRGQFTGIEIVLDRDSRRPPPASLGLPGWIRQRAMDEGLVCYPGGGTADGRDGAHVLLAPPLVFGEEHVDELVTRLFATLRDLPLR